MREFIEEHAAFILRLARGAIRRGDPMEAGDVAQQVVLALLKADARGSMNLAELRSPEAYLRIVVRNVAQRLRVVRLRGEIVVEGELADELTNAAQEASATGNAADPESITMVARDARIRMESIKAALAPRDALAFRLLVEAEMSIPEVAAQLGTTPNNVYQMRHRILTAARKIMDEERSNEGGGE